MAPRIHGATQTSPRIGGGSMSGTLWIERSPEQIRLLNPAFIGALVWSCTRGFVTLQEGGLPFPLAFVAMPVVLHKSTRELLPRSTRTSLASWLNRNSQTHVGFAERARDLVPLVKEGILFAAQGGMLSFEGANLVSARRPRTMTGFEREASEEVKLCVKKAEFVGKWFAASGDYTTTMALWGVTI